MKYQIVLKVRPDLNYNKIAFDRVCSDPRFHKWMDDMSVELNVDPSDLQLAGLYLSGNM